MVARGILLPLFKSIILSFDKKGEYYCFQELPGG